MKKHITRIISRLAPLVANLPLLIANLILGALAAVVLFFMVRASVDYLYQPIFGNPKPFPESEASIDPQLLKDIQQKIDESRRVREMPQNSLLPDPFD